MTKRRQQFAFTAGMLLLLQALSTHSELVGRQNASVAHAKGKKQVQRDEADDEACTPGYDPCIPPGPDVDCAGGSGNGPRYVEGPVRVTGSDPYGLDRDGDGIGCE